MILRCIFFNFIFLTITVNVYGQVQDSLDLVPKWKNNDVFSVNIKSTITDRYNGRTSNFSSAFDAKFIVREASDSCYKVEWTYTNAKLPINDPIVENQLLAKLIHTKLLIKLSETGRFIELMNADEIKFATNKALDELIAKSSTNPTMNMQYKITKQLIASKQGLEIVLLKQIKFYNLLFGSNYKLNLIETNEGKLANPFGGNPFDALEKVQLTKIDRENSICTIETSKTVDGKAIRDVALKYIKNAGNPSAQIINEINRANVEFTENSMHQIDFSRGIIQKSFFKRILDFGFQYRVSLLEMATVN